MKKEEILEGNKLIALFETEFMEHESDIKNAISKIKKGRTLKPYHDDWNVLMDVIIQIEQLGYNVIMKGISCKISPLLRDEDAIISLVLGERTRKLELVYSAVVRFLEWYNKQK